MKPTSFSMKVKPFERIHNLASGVGKSCFSATLKVHTIFFWLGLRMRSLFFKKTYVQPLTSNTINVGQATGQTTTWNRSQLSEEFEFAQMSHIKYYAFVT